MRILIVVAVLATGLGAISLGHSAELRAGAAAVDVTPIQFPVLVNGGMTSRSADKTVTRLFARAVVVDDGTDRAAIVVVDSCMMPRPLLDEAKQLASQRTKIRPDRMLISATHTHTAPASMGCLGTDVEASYVPYLREKLAEAIATAEANLEPAQVGWGVGNAAEFTALRRWIIRPDRIVNDPFGNPTVRANMHAGSNWDDVTGESGPEDPDLSVIAWRATDGRPIAVLANFSMHYFSGVEALNADYFGRFCLGLESQLAHQESAGDGARRPPCVAVMSHGCSGDIWRRDYTQAASDRGPEPTIESYTDGLLKIARAIFDSIEYESAADVDMAEMRREFRYRVPDSQRLQWARQMVAAMGDRLPKTQEEVYAREQILLHERQSTEVVVQALRMGGIGIATTPTETYALTGLKIKLQSPLPRTMVIELANGGDGYIPPPEQHVLGGYNTWPARSAGLEVAAEPTITEMALELLEQVAGTPRRAYRQSSGPASEAILQARPRAYWRLDDFEAPRARDASGNRRDAIYEPGVVFFLAGPHSDAYCQAPETNRSAHFAGGRLTADFEELGDRYSVSLWFWCGMPNDAREMCGWLFSRDRRHGLTAEGDHVGIGGTATQPGKLVFQRGRADGPSVPAVGLGTIERWTWNHLAFVRDGTQVRLYLNGKLEIEASSPAAFPPVFGQFFLGGRSDNVANWEGRLDEIAIFDRPLTGEEVATLARNARTGS